MKYLRSWILFENTESVKKYEIVTFKQDYIFENVFAGEKKTIDITFKKGEKAKVFFDMGSTDEDDSNYYIKAVRPISMSKNEKVGITRFDSTQLWEANFLLNDILNIKKSDAPFDIDKYI